MTWCRNPPLYLFSYLEQLTPHNGKAISSVYCPPM